MPVAMEWMPVLAASVGAPEPSPRARALIETAAAERALQRFIWPEPFPFDSALAMHAATYAKAIGRVVAFSLAAFRQCYAAGRSLESADNVLIAASACEMHPAAVLKGCELRSTRAGLTRAGALAAERGVRSLPAVYVPARAPRAHRSSTATTSSSAQRTRWRRGRPRWPVPRARPTG